MTIDLRRYENALNLEHTCGRVVARFDVHISVTESVWDEPIIFREMLLVELSVGRYRVKSPTLREKREAVGLPSEWEQCIRELALLRCNGQSLSDDEVQLSAALGE